MDKPAAYSMERATAFQEASVADAYRFRPAYPPAVFPLLATLIHDEPRRVLDVGCGTGFLARHLMKIAEHVDAVDISAVMIERGKRMPNGDHPRLRWLLGRAEDAPLTPPYALITAGESLHWMDWMVIMPRLRSLLSPNGMLAILELGNEPLPWGGELLQIIRRFSTIRDYQPLDLAEELEHCGLFERHGRQRTESVPFIQLLDEYIESFHGRASFSRERMSSADAAAFDEAVRKLVMAHCGSMVELSVYAEVTWGAPLANPRERKQ